MGSPAPATSRTPSAFGERMIGGLTAVGVGWSEAAGCEPAGPGSAGTGARGLDGMAAPASCELFIRATDGKPAIVMTNGFAESRRALEDPVEMIAKPFMTAKNSHQAI